MENNSKTNITKKTPSPAEFLRQAVGRKVVVKLHNNSEYKGTFIIYGNILSL
jgi:small nuclear ribonucleoprotein (snRNP)-like protein